MKAVKTTIRIAASLIMLLIIGQELEAQQVPLFNQYYSNNFLAYPSTAGYSTNPRLSLIYRGQWSGLDGAPRGIAVNYTSKLGKDMGFGLNIQDNEIGLVKQTRVGGGVSYGFYSTNKHSLAVGASTAMSFFSLNEDRVSPESFDDELLRNLIGNNGSALSFDFSLSYKYGDNFRLDVAAPTLINVSLTDDEYIQINEDNVPDYIAGAQYRFTIDAANQVYFTPNVTWRYRDVIGSEFDVLGKLDYKEKFSFSGGFRNNYGATAGIGVKLSENIEFSYHYDFGKADIPFLADGFNEIGLHFNFKRNEEKWNARHQEGAAVIQRLRNEGVYSKSLISEEDQRLASDYLYSQQTTGKKKDRRAAADERFDEILEEIRNAEVAKLEAAAQAREEANRAEQARLAAEEAAERERVQAAQRAAAEQQRREEEAARQAAEEKERLDRERSAGTAIVKTVSTVGYEYVVVVASYSMNNKYGPLYLEELKKQFSDAAIFRSEKRGLDYVYVGGYDGREEALARMEEIRSTTDFKDSWVHIIRLSREQ